MIYCANKLIDIFNLNTFEFEETEEIEIHTLLEKMCDYAYQNKIVDGNDVTVYDLFDTKLMDTLMPTPSTVKNTFYKLFETDKKSATNYYYDLAIKSNYIRMDRINKNICFKHNCEYGTLDITINLSKPEKDPKMIALAKSIPSTGYPKCLLCYENMGFAGHLNHPARQNHRIIPLVLDDEDYFIQYSPYVYYNEHCIVFKDEHEPMLISQKTFDRLLDFVDIFPHYFLGSNAGLPIVGGSILTHDHYQGGNYEFPMAKCPITVPATFKGYEDISAGIVSWPLSTIRIAGDSKQRVSDLATKILECWKEHTDEENEILAYTDQPHNAITPIARRKGEKFEMDLILRNNRTSDEHPLGIFHAHSEYHHIKKENIGLIEAMGLAVLPARLATELGELTDEVKSDIGEVFTKILENCGVYKNTETGKKGFIKFIDAVNSK